jgi:uncharacterized protein (TIGR02466 family)
MNPAAPAMPEVISIFATPVVLIDVPDAAALNAALRQTIVQREKTHPSTMHSNLGGWQSEWDMDRWGGAAAIKLLAVARNTANKVTTNREGQPVVITWKANMWANINRTGHGNEFHSHPGSFWSAVYYVDDGGIDADPALGGELEFMDPRGPLPAMYAPHLAFGSYGLSAGANETIRPRAGRLVMFPSWVLHQVRPYHGNAERISIAMNLSL